MNGMRLQVDLKSVSRSERLGVSRSVFVLIGNWIEALFLA